MVQTVREDPRAQMLGDGWIFLGGNVAQTIRLFSGKELNG